MTTINLNIPYPHKVFNKNIFEILTDYTHFTEVHYGGASSGKSHGVVQKVVLKSLSQWRKPRKVLFTRKVAATIKDSIFEDVRQCLIDFKLLDHCKVNMTDYRIELPNGALFLFKGMDNPEKIKSIKGISDVVMEEATEFNLEDYTQLTIRLRDRAHKFRQIFLMFNPVSKLNWVYKYFFEGKDLNNVLILRSTYTDNKFLDESVKANLEDLANRNPAYYRIYALGEFATLDKLVFPQVKRELIDRSKLKHLTSYFGLDFGYVNDPSAFVHVKVDEHNKKLYVLDEYVKKGMLNDEIARAIQSLGYHKERIIADSAEVKSIAEMRMKHNIDRIEPARKGPDSIMNGIQFMSQYDIIVDERCTKTFEEFENYTWQKDKKTNEYINKPVDTYNHCIDAIRYAIEKLSFGSKKRRQDTRKKTQQLKRLGL